MAVDKFAVLDVLSRKGACQVQAVASSLGDQVSYRDVASALAQLGADDLVEPTSGSRWQLTDKGKRKSQP